MIGHIYGRRAFNRLALQGDTPIKPVLQLLKQKKFPLPAMIEWEYQGSGKSSVEVKNCLEFVKAALA